MELDLEPLRARMIHDTERFLERNLPVREGRRIAQPVVPTPSVPHTYGPSGAAAEVAGAIIMLLTGPSFRSQRRRTGRRFPNQLARLSL